LLDTRQANESILRMQIRGNVMSVHKLNERAILSQDDKPSITTLQQEIAFGVARLNGLAQKGLKQSFMNTRAALNKKIDEYIRLRQLHIV